MSTLEICLAEIQKATGNRLSPESLKAIADQIVQRAKRDTSPLKSDAQKAREAAEIIGRDAQERLAHFARSTVDNRAKLDAVIAKYDKAPSPELAAEANLVGVNTVFEGSRDSVFTQQQALAEQLMGGLVQDLEREGLHKVFASREFEREWAHDLFELNKGKKGHPGSFGMTPYKIAQAIHRYQKASREMLNNAGAFIKEYSGFITHTTHAPDRIRRAGFEAWSRTIMDTIDVVRTFGDEERARAALPDLFRDFSRGVHLAFEEDVDVLVREFPGVNTAKKNSHQRAIHFKDADGWLKYNEEFGASTPTEAIMTSLRNTGRDAALMRVFGTNPRAGFESSINHLKNNATAEQLVRLSRKEGLLNREFNLLDGTAHIPTNEQLASLTRSFMSVQRLAKLGSTPFSMLGDLATKATELRYQGVPVGERYANLLSGYFRGMSDPVRREVAELLHAGLDARISNVASRFDGGETATGKVSGALAKLENTFFKITGVSAMTDNQRLDFTMMFSRHFGNYKNSAYGDLIPQLQRTLSQFSISEKEWDALRSVDWVHGGKDFLTPDRARMIPDSVMDAGAREDLALKVHSMFADRADYAILDVGARERALLGFGGDLTKPGTVQGEAIRIMLQFKSFSAALFTKTWGREIHGGQGRMGAMAGLAELVVASTIAGMFANMLKDITSGRDPLGTWRDQPAQAMARSFLRGGAGAIYGDILLSRAGSGEVAKQIIGPGLGALNDLGELYSAARSGDDFRARAVRLVASNTPFANVWYAKAAIDYLVLYQLQEAINPGYLRRMEKRSKDQYGTSYLIKPSEFVGH